MSETGLRTVFGDKRHLHLDMDAGAHLRPVAVGDVTTTYIDGLNDPEVNRFMTAVREQRQTAETVTAYVAANWASPGDCLFGLFVDNLLRGTVRLHDVSLSQRTAILGVVLFDRRIWGNGWGTRAIARVSDFALGEAGLACLTAGVYAGNASSRIAFERAGFTLAARAATAKAEPYSVLFFERRTA